MVVGARTRGGGRARAVAEGVCEGCRSCRAPGPAAQEHRHLLRRFGSRGAAAASRWSDSLPARRATVMSGPTGAPMDPLAPARARDH